MENNIRDFINEETGASTLEVALLLLEKYFISYSL